MWHPPIALPPEEQQMVARTRKTRKFFVFLRERRHDILDTDLQNTLAQSYSPAPGGKRPWSRGCWPWPRCGKLTAMAVIGMRWNAR